MVPACSRLSVLAVVAALLIPAAVSAAPAIKSAAGQATVLNSLSVLKRADLDFGELVVSGAGTAVIDPVSGSLTTTGPLVAVGTSAHPALFTGTGSKNSVVHIRLPQNPITITRVGGTETMTVSGFTMDGAANRKIPPNDVFDFQVGATLNVAAGQVPGTYTGTFDVTVQYP
jgi:uncharacterized protein DUF4402